MWYLSPATVSKAAISITNPRKISLLSIFKAGNVTAVKEKHKDVH